LKNYELKRKKARRDVEGKDSWQLAVGSWQKRKKETEKRRRRENYKLQITNYKQITMSEITNYKQKRS
jgi:hypothetical protein